jgi:F-type H+-transporting ATPase subunit a
MAEETHEAAAPGAEGHGETHGEGGGTTDPLHHIKDKVLFAVDQNGRLVTGSEAYLHGTAVAGYAPKTVGPVKLEFTKHMMGATVVAALLTVTVLLVARRVIANVRTDQAPRGKLANLVEALLVFVRDELVVPAGGHHLAHYTPIFVTYFFFILACNLAGMIPEFGSATGNIGVTVALGGSVYVILTLLGMTKQGPAKYFLHMVPPGTPWPMWPMMFVLEFLGPIIKCFVLCVRLFANMIAGHLVVSNVLALGAIGKGAMMPVGLAALSLAVGLPLALGINLLELLVCLIQAYVFTMLAVIFVGAAVHPQH